MSTQKLIPNHPYLDPEWMESRSRRAFGLQRKKPGQPMGRIQPSPGSGQSQCDDPPEHAALSIVPRQGIRVKRGVEITRPRQGFLARWFSPSPPARRVVPRTLVDNLVASFWTGGPPTVSRVRDISSLGLYVVTPERWYPGTIVRMTLTITEAAREAFETSICVCAEAIRWGNDGVGLRFAVENRQEKDQGGCLPAEGADQGQLDQFLKWLLPEDQQTSSIHV